MKATDTEHEQIARHARYLLHKADWLIAFAAGLGDSYPNAANRLTMLAEGMHHEARCWGADYAGEDWPPC